MQENVFTATARRIAGPIVLARVMSALQSHGAMPVPLDEPRVVVDGPETQRILLLGGIVAGSHGVTSHQLGMAGHLARMVHSLTRRGVEVEVAKALPGSARQVTHELDGTRLTGFDAIITFVGGVETRSLWSTGRWSHDMGALLDRLSILAPSIPVVVVGVTQLPHTLDLPRGLFDRVNRSTDRLNEVTRELVTEFPDARFLTPSASLPVSGGTLQPTFAEAAGEIAPVLSLLLVDRPAEAETS